MNRKQAEEPDEETRQRRWVKDVVKKPLKMNVLRRCQAEPCCEGICDTGQKRVGAIGSPAPTTQFWPKAAADPRVRIEINRKNLVRIKP